MAKKAKDVVRVVTLRSEDGRSSYQTIKNTKNTTEKLKRRKYNPVTRRHEVHTETKGK